MGDGGQGKTRETRGRENHWGKGKVGWDRAIAYLKQASPMVGLLKTMGAEFSHFLKALSLGN